MIAEDVLCSINSSVVSLRTGLGMWLFPVRIPAVRRKTWGESHSKQTNQKTDQGTFHWSHSGTWLIQLIHRITRINSPDCSVCSVPVLKHMTEKQERVHVWKRDGDRKTSFLHLCVCVCVCVCEREIVCLDLRIRIIKFSVRQQMAHTCT